MFDLYFWMQHLSTQQDNMLGLGGSISLTDIGPLTVDRDWGPPAGEIRLPTVREPRSIPDDYEPRPVDSETWNEYLDHLLEREGYRNTVYRDSLGKPTVGVGHLVRPEDNLRVGDRISDEQVRDFLEADAGKAYRAAVEQANELGINDSQFVIALGSVNYQLGTGWRNKFSNTWEQMREGNYEQAIANIEDSLWAEQTPVRTADFTAAIRSATSGARDFSTDGISTDFSTQVASHPAERDAPSSPAADGRQPDGGTITTDAPRVV